jgi:hypothetical protein
LLRHQHLIVLPPQGNRERRDEDQKYADKGAIDAAAPLQRIGLGTGARGLLVHACLAYDPWPMISTRRRAHRATESIRSTIYRTAISDKQCR